MRQLFASKKAVPPHAVTHTSLGSITHKNNYKIGTVHKYLSPSKILQIILDFYFIQIKLIIMCACDKQNMVKIKMYYTTCSILLTQAMGGDFLEKNDFLVDFFCHIPRKTFYGRQPD